MYNVALTRPDRTSAQLDIAWREGEGGVDGGVGETTRGSRGESDLKNETEMHTDGEKVREEKQGERE